MALSPEEKTMLTDERNNDPQGLGLPGCSANILQRKLTAEGSSSTNTLVTPGHSMDVSKSDIYRQLSNTSIAAWRAWIDSGVNDDAVAAKEIWETFATIDMSESRV